jgi:ABC-type transport system involved in multi-copper enzyme maturation permease subunit
MTTEAATKSTGLRRNETRPKRGGFGLYFVASFSLALTIILRRQRLIMATGVAMLPVVVPLMLAFFSTSQFAENGRDVYVSLVERLHIDVLAPLLALFFASMQVGEDVESNTLVYMLTRPTSRAAWVLGRFAAYVLVTSSILLASIGLTFTAASSLDGLGLNLPDLTLTAHYCGVAVMAVAGYGAVAMWLGAATQRPIVYGVLILYFWQGVAMVVPGLVDFLTIKKYTDAMLPVLARARGVIEVETAVGTFQKQALIIEAIPAFFSLLGIVALFVGWTIYTVRQREYVAGRAAGS